VAAIAANAGVAADTFEVITAEDTNRIGCPKMVDLLTRQTSHDLVMFLGDDTIPEPGFLKAAVAAMDTLPDGWGVVGLATEDPAGINDRAHWLAHKNMLAHMGGAFFPIEYVHCFGDDELKDVAIELGRWTVATDCRIGHDHPINKKGQANDPDLARVYNSENWKHDQKIYRQRKLARARKAVAMAAGKKPVRQKKNRHPVKLAIGWPLTNQMVHSQFVYSFIAMAQRDYTFLVPRFPGRIDAVRNDIVSQALDMGVTHLLMTDTDQIYYDTDTIEKLLSHNAPIVMAPVFRRYPPFDPIMFRGTGDVAAPVPIEELRAAIEQGATLEIDTTGMGCVLFDMQVFLDIPAPWFSLPDWGERGPGEDIYFWRKASQAGYRILADCSIKVDHLTTMGVGYETCMLFNRIMEERPNGKRKQKRA
jgi:hypothetical protein